MKNIKKICPLAIVALFLSLILAPAVNAGEYSFSNTFEIVYSDENGNSYYEKKTVTQEQLQTYINSWESWEETLRTIRADGKVYDSELIDFEVVTVSMLRDLKELTYDSETGKYLFPAINISSFIHDNLFMFGYGSRIFSIGRGRTWLPFNRQGETFIG